MTLLDPRDYWGKVPPKWKPYLHFFNTPINKNVSHSDNPITFIKHIANPGKKSLRFSVLFLFYVFTFS